jgi:REP element-mobilizing transposase RayT
MARPLRHHPKRSVIEITTRTLQARYLLRPSPRMMLILQGILARALARYGVEVHAFFYASNHYHLIISIPAVWDMAAFMAYLNGNTAREAARLVDWTGRFWSRRYRSIEILDDEAQVERMEYILSQGVKDGLIAHPTDWPGATCVHALLDDTPIPGIWVDRTALYHARRTNPALTEDDFTEPTSFELTPLPVWAHLTHAERRIRIEALIDKVVAEGEKKNREENRTPMGPHAMQHVNPHDSPSSPKTGNAPRAHWRDPSYWFDHAIRFKAFLDEYREASTLYLRGKTDVTFPDDCFPPPLTFADPRNLAIFPT